MINLFKINSLLFIPAIKERFYRKILTLKGNKKPDGIIFDLEDSVHPKFKHKARKVLLKFFEARQNKKIFEEYIILVRINPITSPFFKEDLKLIMKIKPHILMTSKVETASELKIYKKIYKQLFVVVETLKGIFNLKSILRETRKTDLFAIGYEDLSSELLIERPENLKDTNPLNFVLMYSIILSRYFGIPMIDAVSRYFKKTDLMKLKKECEYTAKLGLIGKVAIHPNQIPIINSIFKRRKDEIKKIASKIIKKFANITDGSFVIVDKGMMDTPSYKLYINLLKML